MEILVNSDYFGIDYVDSIREVTNSHGSNLFKIIELAKEIDEYRINLLLLDLK